MFSENYIVLDKHSLIRQEYVSTLEKMPWLYTSLNDRQYLPVLEDEVHSKLQSFFTYRFPRPTDPPLLDLYKIFIIEHVDGEIKSYDCRNKIDYSVLNAWEIYKHFISSIQSEEFSELKPKIDKITGAVDAKDTIIYGMTYDLEASITSVRLYDSTYNLQEYSDNKLFSKLNALCVETNEVEDRIRGITTLYRDSNKLSYKFVLNYPLKLRPDKILRETDFTEEYRETYINLFLDHDLIDESQASYMRDLLVGKTKFEIEFVISEDEQIEDIFFYHYKIYEFEDLTTA